MERKWIIALVVLCLVTTLLHCLGIGLYSSSSAVSDLKAELESIHGPEYTGKEAEKGTESMEFTVTSKTWFLTNWNLRNTLSLPYEYECRVIFTTQTPENTQITRTITYQAVDPMGAKNQTARAHLDLSSMTETTKNSK